MDIRVAKRQAKGENLHKKQPLTISALPFKVNSTHTFSKQPHSLASAIIARQATVESIVKIMIKPSQAIYSLPTLSECDRDLR